MRMPTSATRLCPQGWRPCCRRWRWTCWRSWRPQVTAAPCWTRWVPLEGSRGGAQVPLAKTIVQLAPPRPSPCPALALPPTAPATHPPPTPTRHQVVGPIFGFLAVQVDKLGSAGVECSERVVYDDCNESLCTKETVHQVLQDWGALRCAGSCPAVLLSLGAAKRRCSDGSMRTPPTPTPCCPLWPLQTLAKLGVQLDAKTGWPRFKTDSYDALLRLGQVRGAGQQRAPVSEARGAGAASPPPPPPVPSRVQPCPNSGCQLCQQNAIMKK